MFIEADWIQIPAATMAHVWAPISNVQQVWGTRKTNLPLILYVDYCYQQKKEIVCVFAWKSKYLSIYIYEDLPILIHQRLL